jgi:NADPH:quinone reductase-like Zn-dependent oxidoreductase
MKAMVVESENLVWKDVPDPIPAEKEVVIDVVGTGVNRADLLQRQGRYPPPPGAPPYLGLEVSGTVSAVGSEVQISKSSIFLKNSSVWKRQKPGESEIGCVHCLLEVAMQNA